MARLGIVGTGFVADLYMRGLATFPDLAVVAAHDRDAARQARFCGHWRVAPADSLAALCAAVGPGGIVLNLTNPRSHAEVTRACLEAGCHVYSEKPLATDLAAAEALVALAAARGLALGSAPCSHLSEAAQTVAAAVRAGVAGRIRLVYAELDDGFIPLAPWRRWTSETGAPWPGADEFETGCTLEHAGYCLTWLIAAFGPVRSVVAASASVAGDLMPVAAPAPDVSVAMLFFEHGPVARLTCSVVAPHNHALRLIGDRGDIEVAETWDNAAPVRLRRRFALRRRLVAAPLARRLRLAGPTHPKVSRRGAAAMNFALGPKEMADALAEGRPSRVGADLALHVAEVTLAIQQAGAHGGPTAIRSRCAPPAPMPWAQRLAGA